MRFPRPEAARREAYRRGRTTWPVARGWRAGKYADTNVDFLAVIVANHVRLGGALGKGDNRHSALIVDLYLLVERKNHRMHLAPEHRIHDPVFEVVSTNTGDGPVIFHSQQNPSSMEVRQCHDLPRKALRPQIVALELHSGVLPVRDQLEKL